MNRISLVQRKTLAILLVVLLQSHFVSGQDGKATNLKSLAQFEIAGAKLQVAGNTVEIELGAGFSGSTVEIPRLAAPIRSLTWKQNRDVANIKLQPELTTWKINWDKRPEGSTTIVMVLDAAPLLMTEVTAIQPTADGSLLLPAHLGSTRGDKIRYEPQPFKNTVGYWAGPKNDVTWRVNVDRPGKFNLAILQGCGSGNGGSSAVIQLLGPVVSGASSESANTAAKLEFEVLETGHFQNFVWRHLGEIELTAAGEYDLRISPIAIKKAALMDVRSVHLIRLP